MTKKSDHEQINKAGGHDTVRRSALIDTLQAASEEELLKILEGMEKGYFETDLAGNITFLNDAMARLYGYSKEELLYMNYRQYTDKTTAQELFNLFSGIYKSGKPVTTARWQVIRKNGTRKVIEGSASLLKDKSDTAIGFKGFVQDITDYTLTEKALKESEKQYRLLADHMKDHILLMDLNLQLTYISPSIEKLLGFTLEELNTISWDKLFKTESLERATHLTAMIQPLTTDSPDDVLDRVEEVEVCCKDGRRVWLEIRCSFIRDDTGKAISILGEGRDVTERRQMENALKKSEERYRSVFENAGLPMVIMEESLLIFMANERFADMTGYEKTVIDGRMQFTDFIASGDIETFIKNVFRGGNSQPVECECRIAHQNGQVYDVLIRIGRMPAAGQFIAAFTDITSRKKAEAELLESRENLQQENIRLRSSIRERYRFCDIIGKSSSMQAVYEFILQAAATPANVIIYGESGTGKELVAKAIHETSERSQNGFVTVHCGAIPEALMESEFFGYKKGAFTGADVDRRGYLDEADGGTLFLDEIGEIDLNMQVKLLRAISGGGYTPVGSNIIKDTDVRIVAATNRQLKDLVRQGTMREDFFYRIHILPIYIPPLRERKDDLPLLIDHFLQLYDKKPPPLPAHIVEALLNHDWPGNVRELQNVLHRYIILKQLDFAPMPAVQPTPVEMEPTMDTDASDGMPASGMVNGPVMPKEGLPGVLKNVERDHILKVLTENQWHRSRTAAALGINRKTLFRKMQKLGITRS
ncbi:MAG: sigma-54-dependent Fis family transcriptional regulator [Thermodesulfobacteriota bacterium]|nr:sigma-54-dependent Fis family transcriptional regulator [Thermodesulfobacteriota bacterium]